MLHGNNVRLPVFIIASAKKTDSTLDLRSIISNLCNYLAILPDRCSVSDIIFRLNEVIETAKLHFSNGEIHLRLI